MISFKKILIKSIVYISRKLKLDIIIVDGPLPENIINTSADKSFGYLEVLITAAFNILLQQFEKQKETNKEKDIEKPIINKSRIRNSKEVLV